jgi:hypothetical protein
MPDDAGYIEQMGVGKPKVAFTQNTALYNQSALKKPYRSRSYEDMEYFADVSIGRSEPFTPPDDTLPDVPAPYEGDVPISPWSVKFLCWGDPCYGYGEMHCETITCVWPIAGYAAVSAPAGCQYQLNLSGVVCGECPEGETFQIIFDVLMRAKFQHAGATVTVDGRYYGMSMSHCIGLCDDTGIAWDDAESADTIAREASVTVAISDSNGTRGSPYSWSVSGVGFTLDEAETTGLTNTLNADDTACGAATITVTGCGGTSVTGYVRCTTGRWGNRTQYGIDCPAGGNSNGCGNTHFNGGAPLIENKWQLFRIHWCYNTDYNCAQCAGNCPDNCGIGNIKACPKCTNLPAAGHCLVNYVQEDEWIC